MGDGIRVAAAGDLQRCLALSEQARWNQCAADWERLWALNPDGCFVLEDRGQVVGTTATTRFESVTWVSMVLVDTACRGRGLGGALVRHAVDHAVATGAASVRLDATPLGRPLYEKLGFEPDYELVRYVGQAATPAGRAGRPDSVRAVRAVADAGEVLALDRRVTGTARQALLRRLCDPASDRALVVMGGGGAAGYAAWRPGRTAWQLGPVIAEEEAVGVTLLEAVAQHLAGQRWIVDVPANHEAANAWANGAGLIEQRRLLRMTRGAKVAERPGQLWASSGPEKG